MSAYPLKQVQYNRQQKQFVYTWKNDYSTKDISERLHTILFELESEGIQGTKLVRNATRGRPPMAMATLEHAANSMANFSQDPAGAANAEFEHNVTNRQAPIINPLYSAESTPPGQGTRSQLDSSWEAARKCP